MKNSRYILFFLCCAILSLTSNMSFAFTNTYTYLRCFYRDNPSNLTPSTSYEWGLDPDSNDYYRVSGYWWSGGLVLTNMFYSNTTQKTLLSVCESTLERKNIGAPVAMFAGADTNGSLNYMIWSNDSAEQSAKINKIVAFGDSLSDMQNMFNGSKSLLPATPLPNNLNFFAGRFSNGKNWLDYLSGTLNLPVYNWAIGGAAAGNVYSGIIRGVTSQVSSWATYMKNAQNYKPEHTLFTMLIGANDLVTYDRPVSDILENEKRALTDLINAGGINILLLNLPDVSRAPAFDFKSADKRLQVKAQVTEYNSGLKQLVDSLHQTYPKVNIQLFDTYSFFNTLLDKPGDYGLTDVTTSCLQLNSDVTGNYLSKQVPRKECAQAANQADSFLFWDLIHPTTKAHNLVADKVLCFIQRSSYHSLLNLVNTPLCYLKKGDIQFPRVI